MIIFRNPSIDHRRSNAAGFRNTLHHHRPQAIVNNLIWALRIFRVEFYLAGLPQIFNWIAQKSRRAEKWNMKYSQFNNCSPSNQPRKKKQFPTESCVWCEYCLPTCCRHQKPKTQNVSIYIYKGSADRHSHSLLGSASLPLSLV